MNANNDLERRLADFYVSEAPPRAPERVLDDALATIDHTNQRRALTRMPWRSPLMNAYAKVAVAAVLVVAVGAIGLAVLGPRGTSQQGGAAPSPSAEPASSPSPAVTSQPTASPATPPPLTQSFTSSLNGISMSYPEGWATQAATEPWTADTFTLGYLQPAADSLYDPALNDNLFLTIASQPIGSSTPDEWLADQAASEEGCAGSGLFTVDGADGLIGSDGCNVAVVTKDGRGYWIQLYTGDSASVSTYDQTWFEEFLNTVKLHPEDAVDSAPSPTP